MNKMTLINNIKMSEYYILGCEEFDSPFGHKKQN